MTAQLRSELLKQRTTRTNGLLLVWLVLYAVSPKGRSAQLRMSLLFLIFIPYELLYLTDYWRPSKHPAVPVLTAAAFGPGCGERPLVPWREQDAAADRGSDA